MGELMRHALLWGLYLSAYMTVAILTLAKVDLGMWVSDYPPDIRERYGPASPASKRRARILGIPAMLVGLAIAVLGLLRTITSAAEPLGFGSLFLHTFVVLMVFNVIDLVVLDWVVFVRLRPRFLVLPGTEDCAGYDDDLFHFLAFLKGTALITVLSAVVAAIVWVAT